MLNGALNVRHLRREPCTPHNSTASLLVDDLSWDVDIANYSRRGICVKEPPVDLTGREVTVRLHEGARSLDFHVMWCRSGTAGMHVSQGGRPRAHRQLLRGPDRIEALRRPREPGDILRFGLFMGDCPAMQSVFRRIERAVSKMGGSIQKAARALGVSSSTIYRHYKDLSTRKLRARRPPDGNDTHRTHSSGLKMRWTSWDTDTP